MSAPSTAVLRLVAEEAARRAGNYAAGAFRSAMTVDLKRDRYDIVTEHDRNAEDLIVPMILDRVPDSVVVGEERGRRGDGTAVTWYVDPIDGTTNFAQGLALWCVSIGAEVDGEIVAGAIYDPMAGHMFSADDDGAYLEGAPLQAPPAQPAERSSIVCGFPGPQDLQAEGSGALEDFGELLTAFSSFRKLGSAAQQLVHVAAGWADAALLLGGKPWDYAAGKLIAERAGATYQPFWYPTGGPSDELDPATAGAHLAPGTVVLGPGADYPVLHEAVERIVARRQR